MNNNSRFSNGFVLGLIIGGGLVFLLGTKTGKNILRIISEEGFEGLLTLLEQYELAEVEDDGEVYEESESDSHSNGKSESQDDIKESVSEPKKRFFKRIRKS